MPASPDDTAPVDPAIRAATAQANLVKLQAEALKAAFGEIAASGLSGGVTTSDGAGLAEGNAQAITGLCAVATAIAAKLTATGAARIMLVLGSTLPATAAASAFAFQERLIARTLDDALTATAEAPPHTEHPHAEHTHDEHPRAEHRVAFAAALAAGALGSPALTAVGLGLSGLNAVLSYARTDFTLGGREVKPHDRALLAAIAAALVAAGRTATGVLPPATAKTVRLDGVVPPVAHATVDELTGRIEKLAATAAKVRQRAADYAAKIARASPKPAPPSAGEAAGQSKAPRPPQHDADLPLYQRALAVLDGALATFDAFAASLLHDDGTGPLIERIAQAVELEDFLKGGAVALITLDGAWSSTLSKKNLLTGLFGWVPFEVNAFVTASWQLVDGATGGVLAAGVESHLAPYRNLLDIAGGPREATGWFRRMLHRVRGGSARRQA